MTTAHAINLRNKRTRATRLHPGTEVLGLAEESVKSALLRAKIPAHYEPLEFRISNNGSTLIFKPDFLLPYHHIDGKMVNLEPHASYLTDEFYLTKVGAVAREHELHVVIISDKHLYQMSDALGINIEKHIGEYWHVPILGTSQAVIDQALDARIEDLVKRALQSAAKDAVRQDIARRKVRAHKKQEQQAQRLKQAALTAIKRRNGITD